MPQKPNRHAHHNRYAVPELYMATPETRTPRPYRSVRMGGSGIVPAFERGATDTLPSEQFLGLGAETGQLLVVGLHQLHPPHRPGVLAPSFLVVAQVVVAHGEEERVKRRRVPVRLD